MTALEAIRVGAWKQAMVPASMSVNDEGKIEKVTRGVLAAIKPALAWSPLGVDNDSFWTQYRTLVANTIGAKNIRSGLYALDGIEYPVASAILCILDPERWPVIDRHAVRSVFGCRADKRDHPTSTWYCATVYSSYARHLATIGHACWPGLSIHELDVKAMELGKNGGPYPSGWKQITIPVC